MKIKKVLSLLAATLVIAVVGGIAISQTLVGSGYLPGNWGAASLLNTSVRTSRNPDNTVDKIWVKFQVEGTTHCFYLMPDQAGILSTDWESIPVAAARIVIAGGFAPMTDADKQFCFGTPAPVTEPVFTLQGIPPVLTGVVGITAVPVNVVGSVGFDFLIDDVLVNSEFSAPFSLGGDDGTQANYNTTQLTDGVHKLTVRMTYSEGGVSKIQEKSASIIVQNIVQTVVWKVAPYSVLGIRPLYSLAAFESSNQWTRIGDVEQDQPCDSTELTTTGGGKYSWHKTTNKAGIQGITVCVR